MVMKAEAILWNIWLGLFSFVIFIIAAGGFTYAVGWLANFLN